MKCFFPNWSFHEPYLIILGKSRTRVVDMCLPLWIVKHQGLISFNRIWYVQQSITSWWSKNNGQHKIFILCEILVYIHKQTNKNG
jgi:hypothetical protein